MSYLTNRVSCLKCKSNRIAEMLNCFGCLSCKRVFDKIIKVVNE